VETRGKNPFAADFRRETRIQKTFIAEGEVGAEKGKNRTYAGAFALRSFMTSRIT
jgi:hypothetical protein